MNATNSDQDHGTNGFNSDELSGWLGAIDVQDDTLSTFKSEYMTRCKAPRSAIKEIISQVRESGVNVRAFRMLLQEHREDRAAEKRVAEMEPDDASDLEAMRDALGTFVETPLGAAAMRRAGAEETVDSLRS